jgi:hypothetical protein
MPEEKKGSFGLSQRSQYIMVGVLAALFGGLLLYRAIAGGEADAAPAQQVQQQNGPEQLPLPPALPRLPDEPAMPSPAQELARDPFALPEQLSEKARENIDDDQPGALPDGRAAEIERQANGLVLKGIMGSPRNRIAFINNKALRAGGTIEGFTVVEVRERSVLLKKDETEVELKLLSVPQDQDGGGSEE